MILNMKGEEVTNQSPFAKTIKVSVNPLLEDERLEDFVKSYLTPFMDQLQFPYIEIEYE